MANPNPATTNAATAAVDEAVRIATESSRRTLGTTQAALAAGQRYLDLAGEINRDVLSLWTSVADASLRTTFEMQNAALASSQALFETSAKLRADAISRWVDVARQAQATTFKTYQSSTRLLGRLDQD
ncbi:MAG: hypothetical protein ACR2IK_22605 [Chloroflexota bacterium]